MRALEALGMGGRLRPAGLEGPARTSHSLQRTADRRIGRQLMAAIARLLEPNVETDEMHAAKYAIDAAQQAKEAPRRSINGRRVDNNNRPIELQAS